MAELYLEDFAVGQRFVSTTRTLNADQIKAFAAQFDPQPFHMDEALAEHTFFHGLAASGWHTASITMSLLVQSGMPIAGGLIGAGGEPDLAAPHPARRYLASGKRDPGGDAVALQARARPDYGPQPHQKPEG